MRHLFICREYPPAACPPGGIGTYVSHMGRLLASLGETVHVIAQRWEGAPVWREETAGGRLIVHRVGLSRNHLPSTYPLQAFSWEAARLAEELIAHDGIDVIEAQEWEAPLYYFQLRRRLNLGPRRRPPCVVHIHSPSERIYAANGWDTSVADYHPGVKLEEFTIAAADAILCPSRFVAAEAQSRYGIDASRLHVIPYPVGSGVSLSRPPEVWSRESIVHIGRLEPRKGVIELAEAAASVAPERPTLSIEFAGADTPLGVTGGVTVGETIRGRLPRRLHRHFKWHGRLDRDGLRQVLSRACAAVVPSRWENFPYSCIEAMSSGLPVIASPNGGMRELIEDGVSGWIAADATPAGLAAALRRALDARPSDRERMGRAAARAVHDRCDDGDVVRRNLEVKRSLTPRHMTLRFPSSRRASAMGVVMTRTDAGDQGAPSLTSIRAQTLVPAHVAVVSGDRPFDAALVKAVEEALLSEGRLLGVLIVSENVLLDPACLATIADLFAEDEHLGIVAPWIGDAGDQSRVHVAADPAVPYLTGEGEVVPCVAVRASALAAALESGTTRPQAPSCRMLLDSAIQAGWTCTPYPAVLGSIARSTNGGAFPRSPLRYSLMARTEQRRGTPLWQWFLSCPADERYAALRHGVRNPIQAARWLATRSTGRPAGRPH